MIIKTIVSVIVLAVSVLLGACESDNEHFCARYRYVYNQLLVDDLPSYSEMKQQLIIDMGNPNKREQAKFMLFVLEDWYSELKPDNEEPQAFCMRLERWKAYQ